MRNLAVHNISRRLGAILAGVVLFSAASLPVQARPAYALADVHGAYPQMLTLLRAAGLTDAAGRWTGRDARLVVLGDMIDRGAGSRDVLDLLMRLQAEAQAAGGEVEVLLGNHEVMNLLGDVRYVSRAEFAAFAADETPAERDAALQRLRPMARDVFDEAYPPGYFGHLKAYRPDGRYGRWLLARPTILKMEGVLLLHGGLSPSAATADLPEINRGVPAAIRRWLDRREVLVAAGRIGPFDDYRTTIATARKLLASADTGVRAAAVELVALADGPSIGRASPVWHRGNALCTALLEAERVDRVLTRYDARAIVVGHTPSVTGQVSQRWGGKLVRLDIGYAAGRYRGPQALLRFDGGRRQAIDAVGASPPLDASPITIGLDALERPAGWLSDCLLSSPAPLGGDRYRLNCDGETLTARFWPDGAEARRELAAFRLSEDLGYGAVPMTVPRTIGGRPGVLRHLPDMTPGRAPPTDRRFCDPPAELELQAEFDALIGMTSRPDDSAGFDADGRMVLAENPAAFPIGAPEARAPGRRRIRTTLADLRTAVEPWLAPQEVEALVQRASHLSMLSGDKAARTRAMRRPYSSSASAVKPM